MPGLNILTTLLSLRGRVLRVVERGRKAQQFARMDLIVRLLRFKAMGSYR